MKARTLLTRALHRGVAGVVALRGQEKLVRDATKSSLFNSRLDTAIGIQTRESVCAPVRAPDGRVIAVVLAINRRTPEHHAVSIHASTPKKRDCLSYKPSNIIQSPNSRLVDSLMSNEHADTAQQQLSCSPSFAEHDLYSLLSLCLDGGTAIARTLLVSRSTYSDDVAVLEVDAQVRPLTP